VNADMPNKLSPSRASQAFPSPGGGSTTVFEDLWLSMAHGGSPASSAIGLRQDHGAQHLAGLDVPSDGP